MACIRDKGRFAVWQALSIIASHCRHNIRVSLALPEKNLALYILDTKTPIAKHDLHILNPAFRAACHTAENISVHNFQEFGIFFHNSLVTGGKPRKHPFDDTRIAAFDKES